MSQQEESLARSREAEKVVRSRFARAQKADRDNLVLTKRDEDLIVDLFLHQAMDRGQLQELHFSSVQRCNMRLRKLFDQGYVARDFHPSSPYGSQAIYRIGPKAAAILSRRLEADAKVLQRRAVSGHPLRGEGEEHDYGEDQDAEDPRGHAPRPPTHPVRTRGSMTP